MRITIVLLFFLFFSGLSCNNLFSRESVQKREQGKIVVIEKYRDYYNVIIDQTKGSKLPHGYIGKEYAELIIKICPEYEILTDAYLQSVCYNKKSVYNSILRNSLRIRKNIPHRYRAEITGMKSVFRADDIMGDGKLSINEMFALNILPDAGRATGCSGISVWGAKSGLNTTITGRNLEWYPGPSGELLKINAVTTIKSRSVNQVCLVGYLGLLSAITGFNDQGVFGAILDSAIGTKRINCSNKRSYVMDLRYALETSSSAVKAAGVLTAPHRQYAYNHLILFSDKNGSLVVENNLSMGIRKIRTSRSGLHKGVEWPYAGALCVINAFMLKNNYNNFSRVPYNYKRFNTYKELLDQYSENRIMVKDIMKFMSYQKGIDPRGHIFKGHLWPGSHKTLQSCVFVPKTRNLHVYFKSEDNKYTTPGYIFIKDVFQLTGKNNL